MDLAQLKSFLEEANIPATKSRVRTHFDISGQAFYEEAISNWYAYFFNLDEDHGLGNLFVRCLCEFASVKGGPVIELYDFKVKREVSTESRKRIDLVLVGDGSDTGKCIVSRIKSTIGYIMT